MRDKLFFINYFRLKANLLEAGYEVVELETKPFEELLKLEAALKTIYVNKYDKIKVVVDEDLKENEIRLGVHKYGF